MINQNELRVGNWVKQMPKNLGQLGNVPEAIIEVTAYDIHLQNVNSLIEYAPIPLTSEILEKCGFVKGKYDWDHVTDGYSDNNILFSESTMRWHFTAWEGTRYGIGFEYLHQLQNFHFALTGEELTVNL